MFPSADPDHAVRPVATWQIRRAVPLPFAVVDLPGRQSQLFDALVAQINHVVEVNFLLRLARDLQNDDPRQQTCRPQSRLAYSPRSTTWNSGRRPDRDLCRNRTCRTGPRLPAC